MSEQPFIPAVGGDVQASGGTYIRRFADDQLLQACLANEFAYVLASRQIGKSSLKNAVAEHLIEHHIHVSRIDLNRIGQAGVSAEKWYFGLLDEIAHTLGLDIDVEQWWSKQRQFSTLAQLFVRFFDEIVLAELLQPIVIFIDEIDVTLDLPFTNDLFAIIRSLYNDRAQNPNYRRLTFVLLGVASPDELINDPKRTPFNIGKAIEMRDFQWEECEPLSLFMTAKHPEQGEHYFKQIYEWTNGHPYLTQKLCVAVAHTDSTNSPNLVDDVVNEIFFQEGERIEPNLYFVQTRVLQDKHVVQMIQTYAKILQHDSIRDDKKSPAINRLSLYGLVVANKGILCVRNRLYEKAFDREWCRENNPRNWSRIIASVAVGITLSVIAAFIGIYLYNRHIDNVIRDTKLHFYQTHYPEERIGDLTTLFTVKYITLETSSFANEARDLFFGLPTKEQFELFESTDDNLAIVVNGLYTTLADVDNSGGSTPLLQAMADALHRLSKTEEKITLLDEINYWLAGRNFSQQGEHQQGLEAYNKAIALNGENLSTRYERASLYFKLAQAEPPLDAQTSIEKALLDLDRIIATLKQADASLVMATPTLPTEIATKIFTLTPTAPAINTPTSLTLDTPLQSAGINSTSSISVALLPLSAAPSISMTTPSVATVISGFSRSDQILVAIRNLINNNNRAHTIDLVANAKPQIYSNLMIFGLVQPGLVAATLLPLPAPIPSVFVPSNASDYVTRGNAYYNQGRLEEAFADYTKAIQLQPDYAAAYHNRGIVYVKQTDLDKGIADYTKAIQLQPDYATAYYGRGNAYRDRGRLEEAFADYTKAIQLQPDYAAAYNNRGNAYRDRGRLEEAFADYTKAIQLQPDDAAAYNNRGNAYRDRGRLEEAFADYTKAIQLQPDYAAAYHNRGIVYVKQTDLDKGIADYTNAIQLQPDYATAYYGRGFAFKTQGKVQLALADLRKYLELQPQATDRTDVETAIAELEAKLASP